MIFYVNFGYLVRPSTAASISSGCTIFFFKDFDLISSGSSWRSLFGIVHHFLSLSCKLFSLLSSLRVVSNLSCPVEGCGPTRCKAKCSNSEILTFSSISADVCFIYHNFRKVLFLTKLSYSKFQEEPRLRQYFLCSWDQSSNAIRMPIGCMIGLPREQRGNACKN